jgi:hypothetical protein
LTRLTRDIRQECRRLAHLAPAPNGATVAYEPKQLPIGNPITPLVLPQACHAVAIEHFIVGDDGKVFDLSLGDQHPIEGVAMRSWKPTSSLRMEHSDV